TSHPLEFSDSLIEAYRDVPQLANFLHLPVQSGSDRVLRAMRRGHTAAQYAQRIAALRQAVPGVALSTDFIVGFPGETEADFEASLALIEALRFDAVYSFKYSPRPGTDAAALADPVPEADKDRRLWALQRLQDDITAERLAERVGRVEEVLVEGPSKLGRDRMAGRTRGGHVVLLESGASRAGELAFVRIDASSRHTLQGTPAPAGGARLGAGGEEARVW
ncbi:MAG: radical SAM protein, partial [Candidatus Methylomirabilis sp.]|nr:radical SAM protein [Deltaproteobacteria bacterium]